MKPRKTRNTRQGAFPGKWGCNPFLYFVCFLAFFSSRPLSVAAESALDRVYARIAIGPEWMQDAELKELFGPVAPGSKAKFDLGSRTLTTMGYKLTDWTSVELDFGGTANGIHEFTGGMPHESSLSTIPVMVNGKLRWPNRTKFTPYIGAGVGLSLLLFYADHLQYEGSHADGLATDFVFSYQAMGGLRYAITQKLGVSLEYRYTGMEGSEFSLHDAVPAAGATSDRLRLGRLDSHTVSVALDANF